MRTNPYIAAINQDVRVSTLNSSTANLNASATFTGTGDSTLGVADLQITLKTDQNCTIYCDQLPDNSNWDIVDQFSYTLTTGWKRIIQAVNSYVRVRITNNGVSATTYFRLQLCLCPIAQIEPYFEFKNIVGAGTTVVKSGPGRLYTLLNNAGIGSAVLYDNTAGSGTKIGSPNFTNNQNFDYYGVLFRTGLTIVQTGVGTDSTIVYE